MAQDVSVNLPRSDDRDNNFAFDKLTCSPEDRQDIRKRVDTIYALSNTVRRAIGVELLAIKRMLNHGEFDILVSECFSFSKRTANNYMLLATGFTDDEYKEIVGLNLSTVAEYEIAGASPEVREKLLVMVANGKKVNPAAVRKLLGTDKTSKTNRPAAGSEDEDVKPARVQSSLSAGMVDASPPHMRLVTDDGEAFEDHAKSEEEIFAEELADRGADVILPPGSSFDWRDHGPERYSGYIGGAIVQSQQDGSVHIWGVFRHDMENRDNPIYQMLGDDWDAYEAKWTEGRLVHHNDLIMTLERDALLQEVERLTKELTGKEIGRDEILRRVRSGMNAASTTHNVLTETRPSTPSEVRAQVPNAGDAKPPPADSEAALDTVE